MHWLSFLGGLFLGGILGVCAMCLCAIAGAEDCCGKCPTDGRKTK